jgi:hypothetical protein
MACSTRSADKLRLTTNMSPVPTAYDEVDMAMPADVLLPTDEVTAADRAGCDVAACAAP